MGDRAAALAEAYADIEQGYAVCGATAIEDRLQDEVPQTIQVLRRAGIKFWMLTGDKYATAVQIATACNLLGDGALRAIRAGKQEEVRCTAFVG